MAFVDELKLHIAAGRGGDGVVRFLHIKGKDKAGPSGGDGGDGGDVYAKGSRSRHSLVDYKHVKELRAGDGGAGGKNSLHGKSGDDLTLLFPVGTVIKNLSTGEEVSIEEEGNPVLLLKGGMGGLGNEHFKSSVNRTPKEWTPGKQGDEADFFIELRLFADLGLVGLPNAGKTNFLNTVTKAKGKVADYPFTTLEPNLGDMYGYIVADIPGLIEGASVGKGLGHAFLRHIQRTRMLAHLISLEHEDPSVPYKAVRKELERYGNELSDKEEIIILTKRDLVDEKTAERQLKKMKKLNPRVYAVSILDDGAVKELVDELVKLLRKR